MNPFTKRLRHDRSLAVAAMNRIAALNRVAVPNRISLTEPRLQRSGNESPKSLTSSPEGAIIYV